MNEFTVIDVETANARRSSICQIGAVKVRNGHIVDTFETLVDPEQEFDPFNIDLHGIGPEDVEDAPDFDTVNEELAAFIGEGGIMVSHTAFDNVAIRQACAERGLEAPHYVHLDSAKVVRRVWPDKYSVRGYGLKNVAKDLGIEFKHHDALEDAKAAAQVVIRTGQTVEELLALVAPSPRRRRASGPTPSEKREGNPEGPLFGEKVVFTGTLSLSRNELADAAAAAGCEVQTGVTKKTTLLVVGVQTNAKVKDGKSTKQRKAEKLIAEGCDIQIVAEGDFMCLSAELKQSLETKVSEAREEREAKAEYKARRRAYNAGGVVCYDFTAAGSCDIVYTDPETGREFRSEREA